MSSLPTNLLGTVAQAAIQQDQVSRAGDAAQTRRSEQSRAMAEKSDRVTNSVEDTDGETDVHDGGGGVGGQGRAFSESSEEETVEDNGIVTDDNGQTHLDLEA